MNIEQIEDFAAWLRARHNKTAIVTVSVSAFAYEDDMKTVPVQDWRVHVIGTGAVHGFRTLQHAAEAFDATLTPGAVLARAEELEREAAALRATVAKGQP